MNALLGLKSVKSCNICDRNLAVKGSYSSRAFLPVVVLELRSAPDEMTTLRTSSWQVLVV